MNSLVNLNFQLIKLVIHYQKLLNVTNKSLNISLLLRKILFGTLNNHKKLTSSKKLNTIRHTI